MTFADCMTRADCMTCADRNMCADRMTCADPMTCACHMTCADRMVGAGRTTCSDRMTCADRMTCGARGLRFSIRGPDRGPCVVYERWPNSAQSGRNPGSIAPTRMNLGRTPRLGQHQPGSGLVWPEFGQIWSDIGFFRPHLARKRLNLTQIAPESTKCGPFFPNWTNTG